MLEPLMGVEILGVLFEGMLTLKDCVCSVCKASRGTHSLARVSRCLEYNSKMCILRPFVFCFFFFSLAFYWNGKYQENRESTISGT